MIGRAKKDNRKGYFGWKLIPGDSSEGRKSVYARIQVCRSLGRTRNSPPPCFPYAVRLVTRDAFTPWHERAKYLT